jgi:hypothetical protein
MVFENRVLRRIFGPKGDEVMGVEKVHSGELHNLYISLDTSRQIKPRRMRWAGHVACMGEERKVYEVLVRKPEGKKRVRKPRHRWEYGIRMDLTQTGWGGGVEWIHLAQDRDRWQVVLNAVMKPRVLSPRS